MNFTWMRCANCDEAYRVEVFTDGNGGTYEVANHKCRGGDVEETSRYTPDLSTRECPDCGRECRGAMGLAAHQRGCPARKEANGNGAATEPKPEPTNGDLSPLDAVILDGFIVFCDDEGPKEVHPYGLLHDRR